MKAKICREAGCNTLVENNLIYCSKHKKEKPIPFQNAIRNNEGLYNTTAWKKLRAEKIKEQPYCSKCGSDNKLHVHHKIPPLGDEILFYDYSNLDVVCERCHRVHTNKEIYNRKNGVYIVNIII